MVRDRSLRFEVGQQNFRDPLLNKWYRHNAILLILENDPLQAGNHIDKPFREELVEGQGNLKLFSNQKAAIFGNPQRKFSND
jgi:hypothetical protein